MTRRIAILALLCSAALASCRNNKNVVGPDDASNRILFIGNSYLYTQNIPAVVQAMAAHAGIDVKTVSVVGPDMALYDHLSSPNALLEMTTGEYTYFVLQQGPSAVWYNRDSLRMATAIYDSYAKAANAKTALFSAWPQQQHYSDFPHAIESYRLAAQDVGGVYMPVAAAWLKVWEYNPNMRLYEDGLHPSQEGAYLAALVVYSTLFNRTPVGMPASIGGLSLSESDAVLLQTAAAQVIGYPAFNAR